MAGRIIWRDVELRVGLAKELDEVAGIEDADDVVEVLLEDGDAGMAGFLEGDPSPVRGWHSAGRAEMSWRGSS